MGARSPDELQAAMEEAAKRYGLQVHDAKIGQDFNDLTRQQLRAWMVFSGEVFGISGANALCTTIAQAVGLLQALDDDATIDFLEALLECRRMLAAGGPPDGAAMHAVSVRLNDAACRLGIVEQSRREESKS